MEVEQKYCYSISPDQEGLRLDLFLAGEMTEQSRSYIQKLIKAGKALVNDRPAKPSSKLSLDDQVVLYLPPLKELEVLPEEMDLDIVYEDDAVIVVNKQKGVVVHPCPGRYSGTLVNGLLWHCRDSLSGINGVLRPGIVHRIDKDTTGLLVVCKTNQAHTSLALQLKEHSITREYHAICCGNFTSDEGTVDAPIGRSRTDRKKMAVVAEKGKDAVTHYRVLSHLNHRYNHIACRLETGRTHQIRVHMAHIGHPLAGDTVYGPKKPLAGTQGQCLHAGLLGFVHPVTGEYMEFQAPLPEYFQLLLRRFQ